MTRMALSVAWLTILLVAFTDLAAVFGLCLLAWGAIRHGFAPFYYQQLRPCTSVYARTLSLSFYIQVCTR